LAKHGSRLPPSSALELIPESLYVKELDFYFKGRMRAANSVLNESRIVANLQKAQNFKTEAQLMVGEGTDGKSSRMRHVTITEERICGICHKRIGGSVINVFPEYVFRPCCLNLRSLTDLSIVILLSTLAVPIVRPLLHEFFLQIESGFDALITCLPCSPAAVFFLFFFSSWALSLFSL
jgi:hypothetical protein